jgi:hypothetical protein
MREIEKTILAVGSHDITLDLMAQFLAASDIRLTSANVGSQERPGGSAPGRSSFGWISPAGS